MKYDSQSLSRGGGRTAAAIEVLVPLKWRGPHTGYWYIGYADNIGNVGSVDNIDSMVDISEV